jgi:hypothetical protein
MRRVFFFVCAVLGVSTLGVLSLPAQAGVVIEMVERGSRGPQAAAAQKLYVQNGNARIESLDASGRLSGLMFFKNDALIMFELSERSFYVLDRPAIAQIGKSMNASMSQMQAELSRLPPEQRVMMEQMMGKMGGGMPPPSKATAAPQFRNTGQASKVAGQSCTLWEMSESGTLSQQLCVVPMKSVPGNRELASVMERMSKLMSEFRRAMPQMASSSTGLEATNEINGFPVLVKDYQAGRPTGREVELVKWSEQTIPASQFEAPAGFRQRDLAKEMQRGSR